MKKRTIQIQQRRNSHKQKPTTAITPTKIANWNALVDAIVQWIVAYVWLFHRFFSLFFAFPFAFDSIALLGSFVCGCFIWKKKKKLHFSSSSLTLANLRNANTNKALFFFFQSLIIGQTHFYTKSVHIKLSTD